MRLERPTILLGASLASAFFVFVMLVLTIATTVSFAVTFVLALLLAAGVFGSGLRKVPEGHRAILIIFGRRNQNGGDEFPEGLCWIYPFISHLDSRSLLEQSGGITNFLVETGPGISVSVTLVFQWSYIEGQLYRVSRLASPENAVLDHLRAAIKLYMGFVHDPEDINRGQLTSGISAFLLQSVRWRCEGFETGVTGEGWRDLKLSKGEAQTVPWGITIYSVEVIRLDLPDDVRKARHAARVDVITAEVAPKVGEGMAALMTPVLNAGGSAELAQQQAQQHQKPDSAIIEPQPRVVVIPSGGMDGDLGAAMTARAIADQTAGRRSGQRRPTQADGDPSRNDSAD